jgi:group I intron endonuclease
MATYLQGKPGIYKITNTVNNKIYIGCASNIRTRVNGHLYDLRRNMHSNSYLQKSWNKYGESIFVFKIHELCDIKDLHMREHFWVTTLNCLNKSIGYNLKPTDPNGCSIHSEETKEKLRQANKGKRPSKACIEASKIYNASELCKINLAKAREKLKTIDFNIINAPKRKKVINIITGQIYESLNYAAQLHNIPKARLSKYLLGTRTNKTNLKYL